MNHTDPEFKKNIEQQIESLPKVIKDIILADTWKIWVGNVVKKNSLNLDQASSLETEVFLFLIGLISIFDLRKSIQEELRISVSVVNDVMIDINDMIIEPIKQELIGKTESDDMFEKPSMPIAQSIVLKQKEEEIIDRQKVLNAIEETSHAPGVGVYVPQAKAEAPKPVEMEKKIQPITQSMQINSVRPPAPQIVQTLKPAAPAAPVAAPANMFEAKTSTVVASAPTKSIAPVHDIKPISNPNPAPAPKPAGSDPYREPVI